MDGKHTFRKYLFLSSSLFSDCANVQRGAPESWRTVAQEHFKRYRQPPIRCTGGKNVMILGYVHKGWPVTSRDLISVCGSSSSPALNRWVQSVINTASSTNLHIRLSEFSLLYLKMKERQVKKTIKEKSSHSKFTPNMGGDGCTGIHPSLPCKPDKLDFKWKAWVCLFSTESRKYRNTSQ